MSTTLLLVDVQRHMFTSADPVPDAPALRTALTALLEGARAAGVRVVHVRDNGDPQCPPGSPGWELELSVREGEPVVEKDEADAFAGTSLAGLLGPRADLVVAGFASDVCVRATVRSALRLGCAVRLVRGAHAAFDAAEPGPVATARAEAELVAAGARLVDVSGAFAPAGLSPVPPH